MMGRHCCVPVVRLLLIGLLVVCSAGRAMATLGQAASTPRQSITFPASGAKALATSPAARSGLYTLHELQLENGTSVREYATLAGQVFAVSWRGPVLPDLNALMGNYFNLFRDETELARRSGRRGSPVNIEVTGLVVRSNGRMRNFFGHAYVPDLIPPGVHINDVLQ